MSRLIDADALELKLREEMKILKPIEDSRDMFFHDSGINAAITGAILATRNAPTIDAVPVVHGRWVNQDNTYTRYRCSVCNMQNCEAHYKYCPNCGARMDGEDANG